MKFDRHIQQRSFALRLVAITLLLSASSVPPFAYSQATTSAGSQANAHLLIHRTIERLVRGDAFDAKLRQRIWASGREVVGVGHYEQSGIGSGRFSMEMTIHDGDSRQTMKQISDGKLAWHRSQIAGTIAVRRVDLGRIDEYEQELRARHSVTKHSGIKSPIYRMAGHSSHAPTDPLPASLRVGGLVELLDRIAEDYDLSLSRKFVEKQPVWVLHGQIKERERLRILKESGRDHMAPLYPCEVRVAITATGDANGFGAGLPILIEFWSSASPAAASTEPQPAASEPVEADTSASDPQADSPAKPSSTNPQPAGRLISTLEIYAMRKINPSPEERFRFTSDDREVTFTNDTKRYLDRLEKFSTNQ
jgi:hypothetical protein